MYYSIISGLALILNLIINYGILANLKYRSKEQNHEQTAGIRYGFFLIASSLYFISDIAWGLLYEHHETDRLFPFLYSDCVLYFIFMFLTMLTWIRYIVAYLDKRRRRSKALLYSMWTIFTLALIYLMINRFHPFIFSFNAEHEYIPEPGRHIAFILQIALYMVTSTYMFLIARKSNSRERGRYIAVGLTCLVMELFLVLQILDSKYPSYALGLIIGICVIHSFVQASEKKEKEIYDHIATSLAEDYEAMYYIDIESGEYLEFSTSQEYASLNVPTTGIDFYAETRINAAKYAHPDDRKFAESLYYKETMLENLVGKKSYSYKYRIMVNGKPRYFRFTVMRANDDKHLVLYEKDIDDEITAETMRLEDQKKHLKALNTEKKLARRDELTGVKNKTAYIELEKSVQSNIDNGLDYLLFALIVCDANDLKKINDSQGHVAGDEYIKECANLLCTIFVHSPVFRVGGDEFVIFLRGNDYSCREELMERLKDQIHNNLQIGTGPVMASGMAEYLPESDKLVSEIFDRADKNMYEDKQNLKKEDPRFFQQDREAIGSIPPLYSILDPIILPMPFHHLCQIPWKQALTFWKRTGSQLSKNIFLS